MTPEEKFKIYQEEKARIEGSVPRRLQPPPIIPPAKKEVGRGTYLLVAIVVVVGIWYIRYANEEPPQRTVADVVTATRQGLPSASANSASQKPDYKTLVAAALKKQDVAMPDSLELTDGGWLVAVYQDDRFDRLSVAERQIFAERLVLAIRNGIYDKSVTTKYRVTLRGKSPGPGLVRQLGSGRFIEGGGFSFDAK